MFLNNFIIKNQFEWGMTIIVAIMAIYYYLYSMKNRHYKNYPPGPVGLPIVGYLPFLSAKVHKDFRHLIKKYGDIFSLRFGLHDVIILNGDRAIKEALMKDSLCSRPPGVFHLSDQYMTLLELEMEDWKEHSRFNQKVFRTLLDKGTNKVEEMSISQIIEVIDELSNNLAKDINIREMLEIPLMNVINLIFTGKAYDRSDPMAVVMKDFQDVVNLVKPTSYFENVPILASFYLSVNRHMQKVFAAVKLLEKDLRSELDDHEVRLNDASLNDYLDYFLLEIKKRSKGQNNFTKNTAVGIVQTFLIAGSDTSRTAIEFALMQMARDQGIQSKVYQEIIDVFGTENLPTWKDKIKMSYTNAVLMENSRRNPTDILGLTRCASEDVKVMGFDIPKGTLVFPNLAGLHMDPRYWKEPERFIPERFLTENGKVVNAPPTGFLPFSYGKRACPAERIAQVEIFLFFVSIIQRYKILPPTGGVRMESINRGTLGLRFPFLRIEKR